MTSAVTAAASLVDGKKKYPFENAGSRVRHRRDMILPMGLGAQPNRRRLIEDVIFASDGISGSETK